MIAAIRRIGAARRGAQLLRQPGAGCAAAQARLPARPGRAADLRARAAPAATGARNAAGTTAAGDRRPAPARRRHRGQRNEPARLAVIARHVAALRGRTWMRWRRPQQAYFIGQLELAREFELPVIVHARRAVDAVIAA
ncbi:hypothetical protein ACQXZM_12165, partial [Corynebacterium diphtheriae]